MLYPGEFNWIHKLLQYPSVNVVHSQYILMDDYINGSSKKMLKKL